MAPTLTKKAPAKTAFDEAFSALLEFNRKNPDVANAVAEAMLRNKAPARG